MSTQRTVSAFKRVLRLSLALAMMAGVSGMTLAFSPDLTLAQSSDFVVGDEIAVSDGPLNLRDDAGTDAEIVTVLDEGTTGAVSDGPESVDDFDWYEIEVDGGDTGWVAGEFIALAETVDGAFVEADEVVVIDGSLNLREDAGMDADVLDVMADGSAATVVSGPVVADDMDWYELDTEDYGTGWAAGEFLALADEPSDDEFADGAVLVVTTDDGSNLNLREEPTTDSDVVDELPEGTTMGVLYGPETADGYDWYEVDAGDFGTGWVAADFVVEATTEDDIEIGDTVVVLEGTLNLREDAGLDADIVDTIPDGTIVEVSDGPVTADGYTWFEVSNDDFGPGWVAGEFLDIETEAVDDGGLVEDEAPATLTVTTT